MDESCSATNNNKIVNNHHNNNNNNNSESLCKVCGDKASGKHYGVASCDGCRGFFKRSIRRYNSAKNLEYVCKESGRCVVDVTRRNQCQACRFKKCLQVNMKRDAVQHERAPRSTHQGSIHHYPGLCFGSRLRSLHGSNLFNGLPSVETALTHTTHPFHHGFFYPNMLGAFTKPSVATILPTTLNLPSPSYLQQHQKQTAPRIVIKEDEVTSSEEASRDKTTQEDNQNETRSESCLELPLMNESPCRPPGLRPIDISCLTLFPAENIYESAAKLLFLAIKWAKTIPSFLQLSYRDQAILLEESWNELFVLTASQWALHVEESLLVSNSIAPSARHAALREDARKLREIITRLSLLRVDHTEHACLKALVLFKAESRGLCEPSHVELLQDQTHVMLHEYCSQRAASKGRFGKLLLTLPGVQSVSKRGLEELLFRQTVGDVAIDRLLGDLVKVTHN